MIVEADGYVKVAMPGPDGELEVVGWVKADEYVGWTVTRYDWSRP